MAHAITQWLLHYSYVSILLEVELSTLYLPNRCTGHHDVAHSWLGIPWELHKHKLQYPTNINSPGSHGPKNYIIVLKHWITN